MELFKIQFNKPDNCKTVVKYYMYVLKQIVYNHARISRDVACGQVPPLLSKNQRRGVCDSPLVIVYGGHLIFPVCGKWFDWLLSVDHYSVYIM